jgi:hypothetical protein
LINITASRTEILQFLEHRTLEATTEGQNSEARTMSEATDEFAIASDSETGYFNI